MEAGSDTPVSIGRRCPVFGANNRKVSEKESGDGSQSIRAPPRRFALDRNFDGAIRVPLQSRHPAVDHIAIHGLSR
jgi:hypothetical protein